MLIYTGYMDLENFRFVEKEQVLNNFAVYRVSKKQGLSMFWTTFLKFLFVRILSINKIK